MPHLPLSRRAVTCALRTAPAAVTIGRADLPGALTAITSDASDGNIAHHSDAILADCRRLLEGA